jgi:hypothetical protein
MAKLDGHDCSYHFSTFIVSNWEGRHSSRAGYTKLRIGTKLCGLPGLNPSEACPTLVPVFKTSGEFDFDKMNTGKGSKVPPCRRQRDKASAPNFI